MEYRQKENKTDISKKRKKEETKNETKTETQK